MYKSIFNKVLCRYSFGADNRGMGGMMPAGNMAGRAMLPRFISGRLALVVAIFSLVPAWLGPVAFVQGEDELEPLALEAPYPDRSHLRQAYQQVSAWVQEGRVSHAEDFNVRATGVFGVLVTLRSHGVVVGTGQALLDDMDEQTLRTRAVTLLPLLERATHRALEEVRRSMRDAQTRVLVEGRETLPDAQDLTQVGPRMLVDVQLAYNLTSIDLPRDADQQMLYASFAPGYHGLRATSREGQLTGMVWPGVALASNLTPMSQVAVAVRGAGYAATDADRAGRPGGPRLQRFDVLHMVRATPDLPALDLMRGNIFLPTQAMSMNTLEDMARQMSTHLEGRFIRDGLVRGTYLPTSNRYDPPLASDEEAMLAGYALIQRARWLEQQSQAPSEIRRLTEKAERALSAMVRHWRESDAASFSPAAAALGLLIIVDAPLPLDSQLRDSLGEDLLNLQREDGLFRGGLAADAEPASQATQALIVHALAGWYEQTRSARVRDALIEAGDTLWQQHEGNLNIAALPWYVNAHRRAASLLVADGRMEDQLRRERETMYQRMVVRLSRQQVIEEPLLGPRDVFGGFELRAALPGTPPNPTWQSAQCIYFLAAALQLESLQNKPQAVGWLLSSQLGSRFIGQLMIDKPGAYYARSIDETVGGVRLALWDNRLPIAPTAMSLLAITELQRAAIAFDPRLQRAPLPALDPQDDDDADDAGLPLPSDPEGW